MRPGDGTFQFQLFARTLDAPVQWRLLSRNNREAGRSVDGYADEFACQVALKELQAGAGALTTRIRRAEPNRWVWEVSLDAEPVAVAGHRFDRQIRCEQAMGHFLEQLPGASLRPGLMISDARRWGTR